MRVTGMIIIHPSRLFMLTHLKLYYRYTPPYYYLYIGYPLYIIFVVFEDKRYRDGLFESTQSMRVADNDDGNNGDHDYHCRRCLLLSLILSESTKSMMILRRIDAVDEG